MKSFYKFPLQKSNKGIVFLMLLLFTHTFTFAQTYNWNNVAIGGGGFVSGIITSKTEANVMFARTDVGGAYRWDAANSKWVSLLDWTSIDQTGWQGVESIAMDPQASKNVYMLVGTSYFNNGKTAILRSTDYGNTFAITDVSSQFKAHGNGMGRQNGEKLVVDPNKGSVLFCGTRRNGLFKSTDSGANWSNVTTIGNNTGNDNGLSFVLIDKSSATTGNASQTIFFGVSQTNNNLYKSTNGGASFSPITGGPPLMPQRAVLASDKNMYITYADAEGPWNIKSGQIWKYNTTNGAWSNVTPVVPTMVAGFGGISVDPNNANRLIASTTNLYWTQFPDAYGDRFFLSTNGGASWTDLVGNNGITVDPNGCTWITGQSIHWAGCIEFDPFNTNKAYVISGNGVFVCNNVNAAKTTWKFIVDGLEETVALDIVSITGGPLVSVIGDYDGFVHSDITQYAPIHSPKIGTTTGLAVAALSTSKMVRVGGDATVGGKMYYTSNQGATWTKTSSMNGYKGKVALSANGTTILHCPEGSSTMYRSTNNGSSWSTCNGVSIADAVPVADMVNPNKFYAYNNISTVMMVSTDGGANFSSAGSPGKSDSKIARTVPGIEGDIWVPLTWGGLQHSTNSGSSFTSINGVTFCSAVGFGKAAPSASYHTIYIWGTVGGVTGVFASIDKGATWTRVNDDAHEYGGPGNGQFVIGDMNVFGRVYMSTVGRGIAYGEISSSTCTATITSPSNAFCAGGSVLLSGSTGTSYQWLKDSSPIANATLATYTATTAGSYTLIVKDANGCISIAPAKVITSNAVPTATISSPSNAFCAGGSVLLSANTGNGLTYQWSNAAGIITGATNATYTAANADSYTVKVSNANCSFVSSPKVITKITPTTWYLDTDGDGTGVATTTLSSCTQPTGYVAKSGDACPSDANKIAAGNCGCGKTETSCLDCAGTPNGTAFIDKCSICVGGNTGKTECLTTATLNGTSTRISVAPQPFQTSTTIKLENSSLIKSVTVINVSGALVFEQNNINSDSFVIGESLASGMYSVILQTEDGTYVTKIVKFK